MLLRIEKHVEYIKSLDKKTPDLSAIYSAHLKLNAIYWGITSLALMNALNEIDRTAVIDKVMECYYPEIGAFGGSKGHDPHLLFTLSGVQVLLILNAMDQIDPARIIKYLQSLQNKNGSFSGDQYGETDTRFSYCAISCASLLSSLDKLDIAAAKSYILLCQNFDGGFGSSPGAESHAGQIFCCVGALSILGALDLVDGDKLGWWLAERQLPNGGLNGRPEKLEDVCYSWWVLSCLAMLNRVNWIDGEKLKMFILSAQDQEKGGIADRPGDACDIFHTLFGICGLSMLGYHGLAKVDPRYCLPCSVTDLI